MIEIAAYEWRIASRSIRLFGESYSNYPLAKAPIPPPRSLYTHLSRHVYIFCFRKCGPKQQTFTRSKKKKNKEKVNTCAAQKKTAHLVVIVSEAESATNKCASLPFDRSPKLKVLLLLCSSVFKYFTSRSSDVSCDFW